MSLNIGLVSYGSREVAIADALARSPHKPRLYIASKQANPMNIDLAKRTGGKHVVINDLSEIGALAGFFEDHNPDFVFVGPEVPIIGGLRDRLEAHTNVLCPLQEYALEGSKVGQRKLLKDVAPDTNPKFKVFEAGKYTESEVKDWLGELNYRVAIKPDGPGFGKGVGVSVDHFEPTEEGCMRFLAESMKGAKPGSKVIIEECVEGEESSHQVLCDGQTLIHAPSIRDFKRAFDGDKGPNTGSMGSYSDAAMSLPFMTAEDRAREEEIVRAIFENQADSDSGYALLGVPYYMAYIHTALAKYLKTLEINCRFGDPEGINVVTAMETDIVEALMAMNDGGFADNPIRFKPKATVVIYKVPPTYGGKEKEYVGSREVNLKRALKLMEDDPDKFRVYPGDMELSDGRTLAIKSRSVACVGIGDNIEQARGYALQVVDSVEGGSLWYRSDIASPAHIQRSVRHMARLRGLS